MASTHVESDKPTSRRGYLSRDELEQFANITVEDPTEVDDRISQAEEIIDMYVDQPEKLKYIPGEKAGIATDGTKSTLIDTSADSPFSQDDDYYKGCELEIIGGTNEGERRRITSYDKDTQTVTVADDFTSAIDSTSAYVIRQLGIFPRRNTGNRRDVRHINNKYYKRIPEAVRRATAAQVEYMIEKGDSFFKGGADFSAENIDDYGYQRSPGAVGKNAMIAPKARLLLKGFKRRTGELVAPNPTEL